MLELSAAKGEAVAECLVCQEQTLEVPLPGDHLVSTAAVVAFHRPPWPPPAEDVYLGYLLVTSRRHVPGFADLSDEESAEVGQWISRLSRALRTLGAERVYLAVVGHAVPHLHVHLIPRWPGTPDDVSWRDVDEWEGARRGNVASAAELVRQIRDVLATEPALDAP
jgi:histidine triad (HIT) family protein